MPTLYKEGQIHKEILAKFDKLSTVSTHKQVSITPAILTQDTYIYKLKVTSYRVDIFEKMQLEKQLRFYLLGKKLGKDIEFSISVVQLYIIVNLVYIQN